MGLSLKLKAFPNLTSSMLLVDTALKLKHVSCHHYENESLLNEHVLAQSPHITMSCVCLQDKTIQMYYVGSYVAYVIARKVLDDIHINY